MKVKITLINGASYEMEFKETSIVEIRMMLNEVDSFISYNK